MLYTLKESKSSFNTFLTFLFYIGLFGLIFSIYVYFAFPNHIPVKPSALVLVLSVAAYCCALAIVHELIKINDTIASRNPFILENVKRMRKIAVYLFMISSYIFVKDWLNFKIHIFAYTFNKGGLSTDSEGLVFVLLGFLVLTIAKIFKSAVEIKKENDLTI